jgi:hypothetical protein
MQKEMPKVLDCEATQCAYNKDKQCHAIGITVGDEEPCCDTFYNNSEKGGAGNFTGGVGACKVADCEYNTSLECSAPGIHMVINIDHPDCGTYEPRS